MAWPIIGLIGRARAGKDTVAARLVEAHGYVRVAFADALREVALAFDPIIVPVETASPAHPWAAARLSEIINQYGWEEAKDRYPEVRRTLQRLGCAIRDQDRDFWVRIVHGKINDETRPVVVSDVRFANEATMLRQLGGRLVRVVRPGLAATDTHVSETALDRWPTYTVLYNDSDISALHARVDRLADHLADRCW